MKSREIKAHPLLGNCKGFFLLEVMIVLFILGIAIIPMLNAFTPAIRSSGSEEMTTVFTNQVRSTLSRLAGRPFATLNSNQGNPANLALLLGSQSESDKETFTFGGKSYAPVVAVTDASGGAGNLLEITVSVENVSFSTLKAGM